MTYDRTKVIHAIYVSMYMYHCNCIGMFSKDASDYLS
jgi:hypothetical protein